MTIQQQTTFRIPIGIDDYKELITPDKKYLFVDKTALIEEILLDGNKVSLITRPRRWGKTLNMSMLSYFLSNQEDKAEITQLLQRLNIAKSCHWQDFHQNYQNQYPVIFLSLKDIKTIKYDEFIDDYTELMREIYGKHHYLIAENSPLTTEQKSEFLLFMTGKSINIAKLKRALKTLSYLLHQYYKKSVYIIIDEYDTPLNSAYDLQEILSERENNDFQAILDFMRGVFSHALKGNESLKKAIITGILRVGQESLFSGLNNLGSFTILNKKFSHHFGFTQDEVEKLFQESQIPYTHDIKDWYNGYHLGDQELYNPWSIMNCINQEGELGSYWVNTGENQLISRLFYRYFHDMSPSITTLLQGKPVDHIVLDTHTIFHRLHTSEKSLWSLMVMTGYLDVLSHKPNGRSHECRLTIPNREVMGVFEEIIKEWLSLEEATHTTKNLMYDLISGKLSDFKEKLNDLLQQVVSFHDTTKPFQESFYHGLILGTTVLLKRNFYTVESNREAGYGRFDLVIVPKDKQLKATILEFKAVKSEGIEDIQLKNLLQSKAQEALNQIELKKYDLSSLFSGREPIQKIGIAFSGKHFAIAQ